MFDLTRLGEQFHNLNERFFQGHFQTIFPFYLIIMLSIGCSFKFENMWLRTEGFVDKKLVGELSLPWVS